MNVMVRPEQKDLYNACYESGEIADAVYKSIRPTGSITPWMYGEDNVHLRPILSMVGLPLYATTKWLVEILRPVLSRLSKHAIKDRFEFNNTIMSTTMPHTGHMCSFDIKILFTCVPLHGRDHSDRCAASLSL